MQNIRNQYAQEYNTILLLCYIMETRYVALAFLSHSPPSRPEVKNERSSTSLPPYDFHVLQRGNCIFTTLQYHINVYEVETHMPNTLQTSGLQLIATR